MVGVPTVTDYKTHWVYEICGRQSVKKSLKYKLKDNLDHERNYERLYVM